MQARKLAKSSEVDKADLMQTNTPTGLKGFEMISNMTNQKFIADPPGQMNLRTHTNAPTTIIDLPSPVNMSPHNQSHAQFSAVSAKSGVAYRDAPAFPYLARMMNKAAGHTQKRVIFDRSDYDDLLG